MIPERSGGNDCSSGGKEQTKEEKNSAKCAAAERALRPEALESSCWLEPPRPGLRVREGDTLTDAVIFDIIQIVYIADMLYVGAVAPRALLVTPLMRSSTDGQQFTQSRWDYV